jgi:hypothetical protein
MEKVGQFFLLTLAIFIGGYGAVKLANMKRTPKAPATTSAQG